MTTVQEIEEAIKHLPKTKMAEFRAWFEKFDASHWDKRFERDVRTGKLDALADQALEDLDSDRCSEL